MEATQETNQQTPLTSDSQIKKAEKQNFPLTSEQIFCKISNEMKECLQKSVKAYQVFPLQNLLSRPIYKQLSDLQLHCLVMEIQAFFSNNRTIIFAQMAVIRCYHEMIIRFERARTYIAGVFPIIFVQTLGSVKDEGKNYYVRELKALYRIWFGYMDGYFLRKIRDQAMISCQIDIMDIDIADKILRAEISNIKHSSYIAQKIIFANANSFAPIAAFTPQRPVYRPKFNSWKRKNSDKDKDQTLSNQTNLTNVANEEKQLGNHLTNQSKETLPPQQDAIQRSLEPIGKQECSNKVQQVVSGNSLPGNITNATNQTQDLGNQKKGKKGKTLFAQQQPIKTMETVSKPLKQAKQPIKSDSVQPQDKASRLKQMYVKLMLSKQKKIGNKLLVQSGTWQFCDNIIQTVKEKTFKQEIYWMISAEIEAEEEEWVYPSDKFDRPDEKSQQPFSFSCKFCGSKLQALIEDGREYFKDILFFEMRKEARKFGKEIPCFHVTDESKKAEGLFLLHKDCFVAIYKGKIDESKWKLE